MGAAVSSCCGPRDPNKDKKGKNKKLKNQKNKKKRKNSEDDSEELEEKEEEEETEEEEVHKPQKKSKHKQKPSASPEMSYSAPMQKQGTMSSSMATPTPVKNKDSIKGETSPLPSLTPMPVETQEKAKSRKNILEVAKENCYVETKPKETFPIIEPNNLENLDNITSLNSFFYVQIHIESIDISYKLCDDFGFSFKPYVEVSIPSNPTEEFKVFNLDEEKLNISDNDIGGNNRISFNYQDRQSLFGVGSMMTGLNNNMSRNDVNQMTQSNYFNQMNQMMMNNPNNSNNPMMNVPLSPMMNTTYGGNNNSNIQKIGNVGGVNLSPVRPSFRIDNINKDKIFSIKSVRLINLLNRLKTSVSTRQKFTILLYSLSKTKG